MSRTCLIAFLVVIHVLSFSGAASRPEAQTASQRSTPENGVMVPQIILTDDVLARLKALRQTDPAIAQDHEVLIAAARAYLKEPTIAEAFRTDYKGDPSALHGLSEKAVERLTTIAMAWRVTGEARYAARGRQELLGLAQIDSWYPAHFLGLTRITLAVALGYSWLSDALEVQDHEIIRTALVDKALKPGIAIYDKDRQYFDTGWIRPHDWLPPVKVPDTLPDGTATADITWPVASFNWNIVCNTGLIVAALAVSGAEPDLAAQVIESAQLSLRNGLALFAPDGAWPEGPMYGALSARDTAILVTALDSVYGHDFDLSEAAGLPGFGDYLMHMTGPTGLLFNYGDSDTATDPVVLPWLSHRFGRPDYDWSKTGAPGSSHPALNLLWRYGAGVSPQVREPKALWFGGRGLVAMRSAWNDADATYVGFKAGPLQSHHNNLDAGTFVIDAKGVRWAVDLGLGNYDLPGYFTSKRFDYYRTATIGQNTLAFDGANQQVTGRAFVEDFAQVPGFTFAIADLSDPYGAQSGSVRRGVALINDAAVLIQDEITGEVAGAVTWTMHTEAELGLDGAQAVLKQGGQEMTALILSPAGARFEQRSANPCDTAYDADCDAQNPNVGLQRLMIAVDAQPQASRRIAVLLMSDPVRAELDEPQLRPLDEWRLLATLANPTLQGDE
ncbi:heparinase II/III-family protein [Ruegeria sp. 2012CJ41-6]|uniref:Heparinase II/III-family protein n=1 Tax=Ruegeria spongiae TaxID=2942209 RepID=A0ABT0PY67_9RHOB|nr:heparinase II/III family protein [Ruegeria spongiae]MCL6282564.1 heparinase II/III-family protein [Ruegeria spongiae]